MDRNIFEEHEFLPSSLTDHPLCVELSLPEPVATTVRAEQSEEPKKASTSHFSPIDIILIPKAGPRNEPEQKRKKSKSAILTNTPERRRLKREIENEILHQNKQCQERKRKLLQHSLVRHPKSNWHRI